MDDTQNSARTHDGGGAPSAQRPAHDDTDDAALSEEDTRIDPSENANDECSDYDPRTDLPDFEHYPLVHTLNGHTDAVTAARFKRDGARLASASADATAKVWDVEAGKLLNTLGSHSQGCSDVAWSWDGRLLATACDDGIVRLWDQAAGRCIKRLKGHSHYVTSVCFSPSGTLLASASFDETLRVWDVQNQREIRRIPAHSDPITCVEFSADPHKPVLLSASTDGICRVWASHTGECLRSALPTPNESPCPPVTFAKFTPNNKFVLMGKLGSTLQLWDMEAQPHDKHARRPPPAGAATGVKKTYAGHLNEHRALQATFLVNEPSDGEKPGRKYVAVGSEDHHVYVYDLNKRRVAGLLRGRRSASDPGDGHCDVVYCVDSNPAEPMLASAGGANDCTIKLWRYNGVGGGGGGDGAVQAHGSADGGAEATTGVVPMQQ